MERNDKTRVTVLLFETLVRRLIDVSFRFPGGESGRRTVAACLELPVSYTHLTLPTKHGV